MQIIPAIDIIDGKCVRLTQGDYNKKQIYNENPLEVAKMFENAGLQRLHLVDLDGAKAGKVSNWKVLETITSQTKLSVDFGGGVKHKSDVDIILNSGAKWVTIGSLAVSQPTIFKDWISEYGAEKFFLGADIKDKYIAIKGWTETSEVHIYDFINEYQKYGINYTFCTDVSKDGLLQGPSIDRYTKILEKFPHLELVASGGVSSLEDLHKLKTIGCSGAIVGKAIYENRISIEDLSKF